MRCPPPRARALTPKVVSVYVCCLKICPMNIVHHMLQQLWFTTSGDRCCGNINVTERLWSNWLIVDCGRGNTWTESQSSTVMFRRVCHPALTASSPGKEYVLVFSSDLKIYFWWSFCHSHFFGNYFHFLSFITSIVLVGAFLLLWNLFPFLSSFNHLSSVHQTKAKGMTVNELMKIMMITITSSIFLPKLNVFMKQITKLSQVWKSPWSLMHWSSPSIFSPFFF